MLATNIEDIKDTGFDTVALFFMLFLLNFFNFLRFYFGFGLLLPLLSSIDDALVHIYNLGRYGIVIIVLTSYIIVGVILGTVGGETFPSVWHRE